MKQLHPVILFAIALVFAQNCTQNTKNAASKATVITATDPKIAPITLPLGFNDYWYAGNAELCTYSVSQERYGEIRQAEQVNIVVTEDFSDARQVKLDDPAAAGIDRIPVLKFNSIRRFHTGIYDYSIMQSIFTPISGLPTIKSTTSVQDWCGQVFMQANLEQDGYNLRSFSYFESEGDRDLHLPHAMLEDEIWTRIRINPFTISTGKVRIIPSVVFIQLRHKTAGVQNAEIQIEKGEHESVLKLVYYDIPRSLTIRFETKFPYKILDWEEVNEGKIASKGELKATRKSAYWKEHDNIHAPLRDSLQLRF